MKKYFTLAAVIAIIIATGGSAMALDLKSSAFADKGAIPAKYTPDGGGDLSPPLAWSGAPAGTKGFALTCNDPDAPVGDWVHWVVWNIPAGATSLKEGMDKNPSLADGTRQGVNDFRKAGWGGPTPPSGTHRYIFKLYALDSVLELPANTIRAQLEKAIAGHILAEDQLMGTYTRQR